MLKDYTMTPNRAGIPVWRPAQPVIGREDEHQTALTNWARMMRTQYPALTLAVIEKYLKGDTEL